ncbi:MAG: amidohydrolase family protein [Longimicrobiales bacterium]
MMMMTRSCEHVRASVLVVFLTGSPLFLASPPSAAQSTEAATAIVGATLIDGNGGPPIRDATLVIVGKRIAAVGPRVSVTVPPNARIIDGSGKFVTPGLVDTNVHMSPISGHLNYARYWDRIEDLVLQGVQLQLKHGVTTVRDSYGPLLPMIAVRDAINRGEQIGPRMYVAGNIIGWEGPSERRLRGIGGIAESELGFFGEQLDDFFTLGTGEELIHMTPDELRVAINGYLDKGPDFIKYNGTAHSWPARIEFSPRAQKVIVEETHKRGLVAETHSTTPEGLYLSILAGIDLIQHPEALGLRELTDELVDMIVERGIICSLLPNKYTGQIWRNYLSEREAARKKWGELRESRRIPLTTAEIERMVQETGWEHSGTVLRQNLEMRRVNGQKLIRSGCTVSVGADNLLFGRPGVAPEFLREDHPVPEHLEPGIGTIIAIEGLVELGMTPAQAIVAATKNGALASKALDQYGTLEVGKFADLLLLGGDPLEDISNIRTLELVMMEGRIVDHSSLPTNALTGQWRSLGTARF